MVCSAMHKETGTIRAVKELKKSKKNQAKNDLLLKEFHILKTLDHPNILQMHGKGTKTTSRRYCLFSMSLTSLGISLSLKLGATKKR